MGHISPAVRCGFPAGGFVFSWYFRILWGFHQQQFLGEKQIYLKLLIVQDSSSSWPSMDSLRGRNRESIGFQSPLIQTWFIPRHPVIPTEVNGVLGICWGPKYRNLSRWQWMSRAYVDGKFPNSQDESSHPSVLLILTEVQDLVSGAMVAKRQKSRARRGSKQKHWTHNTEGL